MGWEDLLDRVPYRQREWEVTIVERWDGYMYKKGHGRIVEHKFKVSADDEATALAEAEWLIARKKIQPMKMDEVTRLVEFVKPVHM